MKLKKKVEPHQSKKISTIIQHKISPVALTADDPWGDLEVGDVKFTKAAPIKQSNSHSSKVEKSIELSAPVVDADVSNWEDDFDMLIKD